MFPTTQIDLTWIDFSCSSILGYDEEGMARDGDRTIYPYRYNNPHVARHILHLLDMPNVAMKRKRKSRKLMKTK